MEVLKNEINSPRRIFISVLAVMASLLAIVVLFLGENILQTLAPIYPNWAFPAYFIPWFLLMISSIQKLNKSTPKNDMAIQIWILKITTPLFLFTLPFFSLLFSKKNLVLDCIGECESEHLSLLGFETYCMFVAMLALFLLFTLPSKWLHNK